VADAERGSRRFRLCRDSAYFGVAERPPRPAAVGARGGSIGSAATPLGRWWRPSAAPPETAVAPYL